MKLLVVGPDIQDLNKVKNFTGVQAYYLARELRKRGVKLHFIEAKHADPLRYFADVDGAGCDHVLALGLRWFTHQPVGCAPILASKVPGAVTQIHDGLVHEYLWAHMVGVNCTFTFRDDSGRTKDWERYANNNHYIGWAADPDLLYPEQDPNELRVLIDHCYYKSGQPDYTEALTKQAVMFKSTGAWKKHWRSMRVRRLINGGAEDVYANDAMLKTFDRKHVPFPEIAREYRKTHVFVCTHKESVGLTCLEAAYCGAIVAVPNGFLYDDRLATVRHIKFDGDQIPWPEVLDAIDIKLSAEVARAQSWERVVDRMLRWFAAYR